MDFDLARVQQLVVGYGGQVILALLILVAGWMAAGVARRGVVRMVARSGAAAGLDAFLGSLAFYLVLAITVVAALAKFGIEPMGFVAILGAVGFAVGFALQGSLSNFASGVMLLVFRPFGVGDFVDAAGVSGTVAEIGVFATALNTPDNVRIIVPNGEIYGGVIKNFSANDNRRLDMVFGIGYGDSIGDAMAVIEGFIKADARILKDPAHQLVVGELADSSVNLICRVWLARGDYWAVKFDLTRQVKEAFDEKGISIPFPQQDVHVHQVSAA